jgi:hypothetical protein
VAEDLLGLTYLTQYKGESKKTFGVRGLFALLSLLSTQGHAISEVGTGQRLNADPPLTKAPDKRRQWLRERVPEPNPTSVSRSFQRQKERSLPKWNCPSHPITASLKLSFRTKLHSRSISNRVCKSLLKLSVGSREATNRLSAGDLFTAYNDFSNTKPEPAFRRVSASVLASGYRSGDDATSGGKL